MTNPALRLVPMTETRRRAFWVSEVSEPIDAAATQRCLDIVFPRREVTLVAIGPPSLDFDLEASNQYLRTECAKRGWYSLALLRPQWSAEKLVRELAQPTVIGVKPYYSLIVPSRNSREEYLEAGIFDFLPHHLLEVLNDRRAWVTLHVPRADRLGHPENIREIREIRRRYFNKQREPPEVEATYTLMMYEAMRALKDVCRELDLPRPAVEAIFHRNAHRLIQKVLEAKRDW